MAGDFEPRITLLGKVGSR